MTRLPGARRDPEPDVLVVSGRSVDDGVAVPAAAHLLRLPRHLAAVGPHPDHLEGRALVATGHPAEHVGGVTDGVPALGAHRDQRGLALALDVDHGDARAPQPQGLAVPVGLVGDPVAVAVVGDRVPGLGVADSERHLVDGVLELDAQTGTDQQQPALLLDADGLERVAGAVAHDDPPARSAPSWSSAFASASSSRSANVMHPRSTSSGSSSLVRTGTRQTSRTRVGAARFWS